MNGTIQNVIAFIEEKQIELGITLYQPASLLDITEFEKSLGIKMPEEIKEFYYFCNGFESQEDYFRIIPLDEIIDQKKDFLPNQFYIAEYLVYCDMWTIDINPRNSNEYGIYNSDKDVEWLFLTNSFTEFLECFLSNGVFEKNGLYDWHDKVKMKKSNAKNT